MNTPEYFKEFVEDRNRATTAAVMDDDWNAIREYCKKYGTEVPKDETILKAGVYKACQEMTDMPYEVKKVAAQKCIKLGFSPFMRW